MNFAEFMAFLGGLYQLQFFGSNASKFWARPPQQDQGATHTRTVQTTSNIESPALSHYRRDKPPPLPPSRPKVSPNQRPQATNPVARPLPPPPVPMAHKTK